MLGIWIENYWKLDFSNQPEIISNLQKFLQTSEQKAENPKLKSLISNLLKKVIFLFEKKKRNFKPF